MTMTQDNSETENREELAEAVLRVEDKREMSQKNIGSCADYLAGKYRLDAAEYDDKYALRAALTDAKNDLEPGEGYIDANTTAGDQHLLDFAAQMESGSAVGEPTEADQLATDQMIIRELRGAINADRSPAEHLAAEYDINADEYVGADHGEHDDDGLHEALADARARVDMTGLPGHRGGRGGHTTDMSGDNADAEPSPSNPGGVGEPHGQKGPTNPGNPHVSPARFGDRDGGEGE